MSGLQRAFSKTSWVLPSPFKNAHLSPRTAQCMGACVLRRMENTRARCRVRVKDEPWDETMRRSCANTLWRTGPVECASVGGTRRGTSRTPRHRGHREPPRGIRRRSSTLLLSQCRVEDVDDRRRDGTTPSSPSPRRVFNRNRGYKPRQDTHLRAGGIIGTTMYDTA